MDWHGHFDPTGVVALLALDAVDALVQDMVRAVTAKELNERLQYGDMLLLRRERRERMEQREEAQR